MLLSVPPPATITASCGDAIAALRAATQSILELRSNGTFTTVVLPLEHAANAADDALALDRFAATISDDHAVREASLQCDNDAERAIAQIESDPDLYATVARAAKSARQPLDRRLARAWVARLKRAGALVAPEYRGEFQAHEDELFDLALRYATAPKLEFFERTVTIRDRLAHLLGYESWADYRLNGTLAETPARALAFLTGMADGLSAGDDLPARNTGRQYFPAAHTVSAALDVLQSLLGIDFRKADEKLWSNDAIAYDVVDRDTQVILGTLYTDVRVHRCEGRCITTFPLPPHGFAVVANLEGSPRGQPPTFTHDEVVSLFHAFGSAMTTLLAAAPYRTLDHAYPVDFSDAPAQVFEALAWQPEVLAKIGSQWKTGEPLPSATIDEIVASRPSATSAARAEAVAAALFDLRASRGDRISGDEVRNENGAVLERLMNGNEAPLYAPLWAQTEAAPLIAAFTNDPLDPAVGARFRETILEPAGSEDPAAEIANFLKS